MLSVTQSEGPIMTDLQSLLAERDIHRALSRFARILDAKQWDDLDTVFSRDIQFDYGAAGEERGIDALRANMQRYLDCCGATQHLIGSILVDVAGDTATSRAYVQARHTPRGTHTGAVFDSNGEYVDDWTRGPGGWRIIRRVALWAAHCGDPAILGAGEEDLG